MIDAVVFAVLSLAVGLVSIYARPAWLRAAAYAGLVVGILLLWYAALGQPRPQYLHIPSGTVLGYHLDEPNAIYLWLMPNGSAQPLALQLPWYDDVQQSPRRGTASQQSRRQPQDEERGERVRTACQTHLLRESRRELTGEDAAAVNEEPLSSALSFGTWAEGSVRTTLV